ncbi:MAG: hypothetical protein AB1742_02625 [bacterium]
MKTSKSRIAIKLLAFAGSLFLSLLVLELALRIYGMVLLFGYRPDHERPGGQPDVRIVSVGDSFTYGENVNRATEAYPAVLERLIGRDAPGKNVSVVNLGVCETNTSELYRNLKKWIDAYEPDVVVLLSGSANRFSPFERFRKGDRYSPLKGFFYNLRIFKMGRIIHLNLRARDASTGGKSFRELALFALPATRSAVTPTFSHAAYVMRWGRREKFDPEDPLHRLWSFKNSGRYDEGIMHALELLHRGEADEVGVMMALAELYLSNGAVAKTEEVLAAARRKHPRSRMVRNATAYYKLAIGEHLRKQSEYGKAIGYYLKNIEADPNFPVAYYAMAKVYDLQSLYDSARIHGEMERMLKGNPVYGESELFAGFMKLFADKQNWEAGIENWIYDDLKKAAALCRRRGIKLVIQNYPVAYAMANRVLERVARENSLPFVDNLSAFAALEPEEKYLADDDHCTPAGHRVVAQNVYRVLKEAGLLETKKE